MIFLACKAWELYLTLEFIYVPISPKLGIYLFIGLTHKKKDSALVGVNFGHKFFASLDLMFEWHLRYNVCIQSMGIFHRSAFI